MNWPYTRRHRQLRFRALSLSIFGVCHPKKCVGVAAHVGRYRCRRVQNLSFVGGHGDFDKALAAL
jgi:hypothetical protein